MAIAPDPNSEAQTAGEGAPNARAAPSPSFLARARQAADAGVAAAKGASRRLWQFITSLTRDDDSAKAAAQGPAASEDDGAAQFWRALRFEPGAIIPVGLVCVALVTIPAASGYFAEGYVGAAHRTFDGELRTAGGAVDPATALAWSTAANGPLFVGTQSGKLVRIERGATTAETVTNVYAGQPDAGPVVGVELPPNGQPLPVLRDTRFAGESDGPRLFVGGVETAGGLVAATPAGRTLITGARVSSDSAVQLYRSEFTEGGNAAVGVGPLPNTDDVRALVALPGTPFVIAGYGNGHVVRIDTSPQPSDVSPDDYMSLLGMHDAAVSHIAVAAASENAGAMFVTAASDGSLKAWFTRSPAATGRERAAACCGDPVDLSYPGDPWTQTHITPIMGITSSLRWTELLAMSEDAGFIAVLDASRQFVVLDRMSEDAADHMRTGGRVAGDVELAFRPRHREFLIVDYGAGAPTARLYAVDDLERPVRSFALAPGRRSAFAFDRSGSTLAIASSDGTFTKNNLDAGEGGWKMSLPGPATALAFSPGGSLIAAGFETGEVELFNAADGERLGTIPPRQVDKGPAPELLQIVFSEDGKRLIAVYSSDQLAVHSVANLRQLLVREYFVGAPRAASDSRVFAALLLKVFTGPWRSGSVASRWQGGGVPAIFSIASTTQQPIKTLRVDAAGDSVALLLENGVLGVWEPTVPNSGLDLRSTETMPMPVPDDNGLKLSADGSTLLLREADGMLHVASLGRDGTTSVLPYVRPFPADIRAVDAALGRDGSTVLVALPDNNLQSVGINWNTTAADPAVGEGEQPTQAIMARDAEVVETIILPGHGAMIDYLAVSPDGAWLAAASIDGRLRVTNVERALQIAGLPLASLAAGSTPVAMQPETLFGSPYDFLDETLLLKVQRGLQRAGYGDVKPDGILGAVTRTRIRDYQAREGLPETGEPDRALYLDMKGKGLFEPPKAAAQYAPFESKRLP